MFTAKKSELFAVQKKPTSAFVSEGMKTSAETLSGNGALKYSTTGNPFVDQFGVVGSYKTPRNPQEIFADCDKLYASNRKYAILFIFYMRIIPRIVSLWSGLKTKSSQKGASMRFESIMRMIWLHMREPETFWKNIHLFVALGSWKDIFCMMRYDLIYNGWDGRALNWDKFAELIVAGLKNEHSSELIKKYLPQIKAKSACTTVEAQANTMIGKWLAYKLFDKEGKASESKYYKQYRLLKTTGAAHTWQKLISQGKFDKIDFASIHGRALNLFVKGKFLANHELTYKFEEFVKAATTVKYTGFVHELFEEFPINFVIRKSLANVPKSKEELINKQFAELVSKAKSGDNAQTKFIVVRDTSGSMSARATGTKSTCYDIAKAIALYFSEFLSGAFANSFIEFNSKAIMHTWNGSTPMQKWFNDKTSYVGSTNFMSVIHLFCTIKAAGVKESDFPTGILCISDGEFNSTNLNITNSQAARALLHASGFSKGYSDNFVIVLWNLQSDYYGRNTGKKFETYGDVPKTFYISGYEPSVISFLTSKILTPMELFEAAMNQEVLNMVEL
jgi:hypothetical protein